MNLFPLIIIFFLAFIPRLILLLVTSFPNPGWSPHWNLATGILKYHTFGYHGERVTNIEPGYPFFLAVSRFLAHENIIGTFCFQAAFASIGAVFLFLLALELIQDRKAAWLCVFFYAFYPYLIGQSVSIIEVPVFTTLLIASVYFFVRVQKRTPNSFYGSAVCGIVFGLTILVRSMIMPAFILSLVTLIFRKKNAPLITISIFLFAATAPWFLRSHSVDGAWIPPRGGWNFLQGNCPYSDKIIPAYNPDLLDAYVSKILEEKRPDLIAVEKETDAAESDKLFRAEAFDYIKIHPWQTVKLKIKNMIYLFYPRIVPFYSMDEKTSIHLLDAENFEVLNTPKRGWLRELSYTLTYTPIFILALAGIYLRQKKLSDDLILYFIILNFTAVYALCWPATRLRVPMDFILMLFAAGALTQWKRLVSYDN